MWEFNWKAKKLKTEGENQRVQSCLSAATQSKIWTLSTRLSAQFNIPRKFEHPSRNPPKLGPAFQPVKSEKAREEV